MRSNRPFSPRRSLTFRRFWPLLAVLCLLFQALSPALVFAAPAGNARAAAASAPVVGRPAVSPASVGLQPRFAPLAGVPSAPAAAAQAVSAQVPVAAPHTGVDVSTLLGLFRVAAQRPAAVNGFIGQKAPGTCPGAGALTAALALPPYAVNLGNIAGDVYTVTIRNSGAITVPEVSLQISGLPGFYYLGSSAAVGSSTAGKNPLYFDSGTALPGASSYITLTGTSTQQALGPNETLIVTFRLATTGAAKSAQMLTADVRSGTPAASTCASVSENVPAVRGNLVIDKTPHLQSAKFGDVVTWTVTLQNTGLGMVYGARANDVPGAGLTALDDAALPITTTVDLAPNEQAQYQVSARVDSCTHLTNTVPAYWSIGNANSTGYITNPVNALTDIRFILEEPRLHVSAVTAGLSYCQGGVVTATVDNTGGPARALKLSSNLTSFSAFSVTVNSPQWQYDAASGQFIYRGGSPEPDVLDAGQSVDLTFDLQPRDLCAPAQDTLSLAPLYTDACDVPFNLPASTVNLSYAAGVPGLELTQSSSDRVQTGEIFTYTLELKVTNLGSFKPDDFFVQDLVPDNFTVLGLTSEAGTAITNGNAITWTVTHGGSGNLDEHLSIRVQANDNNTCGAYSTVYNTAQVTAAVTCPSCGPLTASASDPNGTVIQNGPALFGYQKGVDGSGEVCSGDGLFFTNYYSFTQVSWAGTVFTDQLGSQGVAGVLKYDPDSLQVEINGTDYTAQVISQTAPALALDFSNLAASGAPTTSVQMTVTYVARADASSLDANQSSRSFYDWSILRVAGASSCTGNQTYYQAAPVTVNRADLQLSLPVDELTACQSDTFRLGVTNANEGTATGSVEINTLLGSRDLFSPTYTYTGDLIEYRGDIVPMVAGQHITWTLDSEASLPNGGTISFPLKRVCGPSQPWQAGITYQDQCGTPRSATASRTPTLLQPKLSLFLTPAEYLVTGKTATYRIYVTNNGDGVASNVVITDVLGSGLRYASETFNNAAGAFKTTWQGDGNDVSWVVPSIAAGDQAYLDVIVDIVGCGDLISTVNIQAGCDGTTCAADGPQSVRFVRPAVSLLSSNNQTANLPLCGQGLVSLTVKNTSVAADLFNYAITDTLQNLTYVAGSALITVTSAAGAVITPAVSFEPQIDAVSGGQTLRWDHAAAGGDSAKEAILYDRRAGDIVLVTFRVATNCASSSSINPGNTVKAFARAEEACTAPLSSSENAKTLRTTDPSLTIVKDVRHLDSTGEPDSEYGTSLNASAGDQVEWRVRVTNAAGAQAVKYLIVTDTLPSNFTPTAATPGYDDLTGPTIVWGADGSIALPPNTTYTYYITGTVKGTGCAPANTNTAETSFCCSAGLACGFGGQSNSASISTEPNVTLSPANASVDRCGGGPLSVSINNTGPAASNFVFSYTLPASVIYNGEGSYTPLADVHPALGATGTITWQWHSLANGTTTLRFNVKNGALCPAIGGQTTYSDGWFKDSCGVTQDSLATRSATLTLQTSTIATASQTPAYQTVQANQTYTWNIAVPNSGSAPAHGVVVTETLESGWLNVGATNGTPGGAVPVISNGPNGTKIIVWTVGDIAANATWRATFHATVSAAPTSLRTTLSAATQCADGGCAQARTVTTYSAPEQNFAKTVSKTPTTLGELFAYTITDQFYGQTTYTNVSLVDTLPHSGSTRVFSPTDVIIDNANTISNTWTHGALTGSTLTVTPSAGGVSGNLAGPEAVTVTVKGVWANLSQVQDASSFPNSVTVNYTDDGHAYSRSASVSAAVAEPALQIRKSVSPATTGAGGMAVYTVDLYHPAGNTLPAYNVAVNDVIPAGLTYNPGSLILVSGPTGTLMGTTAPQLSAAFELVDSSWTSAHPVRLQYSVVVTNGAQPGAAYDNTATATWMSWPTDEWGTRRTGAGGVNDYVASDSAQLGVNEIALSKTGPETVMAGNPINYNLTVHNFGPLTATGVTVTDTMPFEITGLSTTPGNPTCTVNASVITCRPANIAPGGSYSIDVFGTVTADTPAGTNLHNVATMTAASPDGNTVNNTAAADTVVLNVSDVVVTKNGPGVVTAGGLAVYALTLTNEGPSVAPNVDLKDYLPAGATFESLVSERGPCTLGGICQFGAVGVGARHAVTATVRVPAAARGTLVNQAEGFGGDDDPDPSNNRASTSAVVVAQADVQVSQLALPDPVAPGSGLLYQVVVANAGPSDAADVRLTDTLPAGVSFVSGTAPCVASGGQVTCALGTLAAGAQATYLLGTLVADGVVSGTQVVNAVVVGSATSDPELSNNTAQAAVRVAQAYGPPADVRLDKRQSDPPEGVITAGERVTYTLTIANAGPATATNVQVRDLLPAGLQPVRVQISNPDDATAFCTLGGTCYVGRVYTTTTALVTLVALVAPAVADGSELVNQAQVSADQPDPDVRNNVSSAPTAVQAQAALVLSKRALQGAVAPGGALLYSLAVSNRGPSAALGVVVTDTLPGGVTFDATASAECEAVVADSLPLERTLGADEAAAGVVVCRAGTLAPGGQASFLVGVLVSSDVVSGTQLANAAAATTTTPHSQPVTATVTTPVRIPLGPAADLRLSKTASAATVVAGQMVTYTLVVTNDGPEMATHVRLVDSLPGGVQIISTTTSRGVCDNGINCMLGNLAAGGAATVTVTARVAADRAGQMLVNTAMVEADQRDPTPANNLARADVSADGSADLFITKRANPSPATAGQALIYQLTVGNRGPSNAAHVTVSDTLPADLLNPVVASSQGACMGLPCDLGTLVAGGSANVTIIGTLAMTATGTLTNTAAVTSTTPLTNTGDDEASVNTPVEAKADLSLTKSVDADTVLAGDDLTYTLIVHNAGPSTAQGVSIADSLPAGVSFVSASTGCTIEQVLGIKQPGADSQLPVICDVGTLAAGGSQTFTITVRTDAGLRAGTTLRNTAGADTDTPDPDTANNTAGATATVARAVDLTLAQVAEVPVVTAGGVATFTLTITNSGPSDADQATAEDNLPAGLSFISMTPAQGSCAALGHCDLGSLAAGAHTTITVLARVAADAVAGTVFTNAATVFSAGDTNPANDTGTASVTVVGRADLYVRKTASPSPAMAGQTLTYQITVGNRGPSMATNVVVSDTLPAALLDPAITASQGECPGFPCDLGSIAAGGSANVTIVGTLATTAAGTLTNTAVISSTTPLYNMGDDQATVMTPVQSRADLDVSKLVSPDPVFAGQTLAYTVTVHNMGPSASLGVRITDTLPSYVSFITATTGCAAASGRVVCTLASLDAAASATFTLTARVASSTPQSFLLINRVKAGSLTADPNPANNTASAQAQVLTSADVTVVKSGPATAQAGDLLTYTLTITNNGPSDAQTVDVKDSLPVGLVLVSATPAGGMPTGGACAGALCQFGTLPPVAVRTVTVVARVPADFIGGLTNTATVFSGTPDPDISNNSSSAVTSVGALASLHILKRDLMDPVAPGAGLTYMIAVSNTGPSAAEAVRVTDVLPPGLSFTGSTGNCAESRPGTLSCALGALAPGSTTSFLITALVHPTVVSGTVLINTAAASSTTPLTGSVLTATAQTTVQQFFGPPADMAILKTVSGGPIVAGNVITYTLEVANYGPATATDVQVADPLPAGLTVVRVIPSQGVCDNTINCLLGVMPYQNAPSHATITIVARVNSNVAAGTTLTNTAYVQADQPDPVAGNNDSAQPVSVIRLADLRLTKRADASSVVAGNTLNYTLAITNAGPSDATGVVITDTLPPSVTLVTGPCAAQVGSPATLICPIGNMAAGTNTSINLVVAVAPRAANTITNHASVTSQTSDPAPANNADLATTRVSALADLSIVKTSQPLTANPGRPLSYTLTIRNDGPSDALSVVVTDVLPSGASFLYANPTPNSIAGPVVWQMGELPTGASRTVQIAVMVTDTLTQTLTNTGIVGSPAPDPDATNNTSTLQTPVQYVDLNVRKDDGDLWAVPNRHLTYMLTIHNQGNVMANNVLLTDTLPAQVTFVSATGGGVSLAGNQPGGAVTWPAFSVGAGATVTRSVTVQVVYPMPLGIDTVVNQAHVIGDGTYGTDPTPADNTTSHADRVPPDLSLTKSDGGVVVEPGATVIYTLTYRNVGSIPAIDAWISETVPLTTSYSAQGGTNGWSCAADSPAGTVCAFAIGALAPGASGQIHFAVRVQSPLPSSSGRYITNTALIADDGSRGLDQNPADNFATAVTVIGMPTGFPPTEPLWRLYLPLIGRR